MALVAIFDFEDDEDNLLAELFNDALEELELHDDLHAVVGKMESLLPAFGRGFYSGIELAGIETPDENFIRRVLDDLVDNPDAYFAGLIDGFGTGANDLFESLKDLVFDVIPGFYELVTSGRLEEELDRLLSMLQDPQQLEELVESMVVAQASEIGFLLKENRKGEIARRVGYLIGLIGFEIVMAALAKGASSAIRSLKPVRKVIDRAASRRRKLDTKKRRRRESRKKEREAKRARAKKKREEEARKLQNDMLQRRREYLRQALHGRSARLVELYMKHDKLSLDPDTIKQVEDLMRRSQTSARKAVPGKNSPERERGNALKNLRADTAELDVLNRLQKLPAVKHIEALKPDTRPGGRTADWKVMLNKTGGGVKHLSVEVTAMTGAKSSLRAGDVVSGSAKRISEIRFKRTTLKQRLQSKIKRGQITPRKPGVLVLKALGKISQEPFGLTRSQVDDLLKLAARQGVKDVYVNYRNKLYHLGKVNEPGLKFLNSVEMPVLP